MSSMHCFICYNTIHEDTNEDTREKYRELVGMKLSMDSHLCHICCHMLNKLWLFKSICLKRSMEYPVLFSDKGTVTLQTSNIQTNNLCPDIEECDTNTDAHDLNQSAALEDNLDVMETTKDNGREIKEENNKNEENNSDQDFEDAVDNTDNLANNDEDKLDDKEFDIANDFDRVILSIEEQKAELEAKRREDKYLEAEFKCYNCALGFLFKDTYQAHMMRHEESNGEHLCRVCSLRFACAAVLRAHCAAHRERAACRRCGRAVRPRRQRAHAARCRRAPKPPRAPCPRCGQTFPDANGLQQHIKRFHLSKTSNKTYSCSVCGKTYNNQGAVRTHMIKHINKKFTCDQCPSTFSSPYTLAQHRKKHSSHEEHRCDACNLSYGSRKSLLAHLRNSLTHQQTIFPCPICARPCPHRRALASHIQTAHATHKAHACTLCPARYTSRKSLVSHMRGHEGREVKVAVCHLCGASFKGNSKLNRHLRSVCEKAKLEEELSDFYSQELEKDNSNQLM